ncbi:hypothetical protein CPter91_1192 [Collimonas pratensis]|uniref:Uncharacterized protein n=1 Tax=Collimonas pratensis TaxID=279113 RepID=A0A127Q166_9BURK|nr:hypothetical protein CPter91_1192 [Collimonas pratensis]
MTKCELRIGDRNDSHNLDETRKRKTCRVPGAGNMQSIG